MRITITKRVDGTMRIGHKREKHWATGLTYGDDEIVTTGEIEIPTAYVAPGGYGYINKEGRECDIYDHPEIRKAIKG